MKTAEILELLPGVARHGDCWKARCPAHHDKTPSLSIKEAEDGRTLLKCFAGCTIERICGKLDITTADLFVQNDRSKARIVGTYDYHDHNGKLIFQVVRYDPKDFKHRKPDENASDRWVWNTKGVKKMLFRLPDILRDVQSGKSIFVCEGEKDVFAMVERGFSATCNSGGAGKWQDSYTQTLRAANVVIIADKDKAGRDHARLVAGKLYGVAKSLRLVELPDVNGKPVKDACDFFAAGGDAAQIGELVVAMSGWTAPIEVKTSEMDRPKDDLRDNLWSILTNRSLTHSEQRTQIANAVVSALTSRGRFFFHTGRADFNSAMYFDNFRKLLLRIHSDAFRAWLSEWVSINRADSNFKYIFAEVETAALAGSQTTGIVPESFWASRPGAIYLSNGDGNIAKITAGKVEIVDNGEDGVLFSVGNTLDAWKLTDPKDPFTTCRLFSRANCAAIHGLDLLRLWIFSLPTNPASKPPLCLAGAVRSGKTRLAKGIAELYGLPVIVNKVAESDENNFWASLDAGGLFTLDNCDTNNKWLADAVASASTDGCSQRRKLYTDADRVSIISLNLNPTDMAMSQAGDALYVINTGSRTISKVNLDTFTVVADESISTPNTYDPNNPLHLAVGKSNLIYFTDGAWAPAIYALNYSTGTSSLVFDPNVNWFIDALGTTTPNGTGGMAVTRNGNTVYTWLQYGWSAGWGGSVMTRLSSAGTTLSPLEYSPELPSRDPVDTPVLIDAAETRVFNKIFMVAATNVSVLLSTFSENIYAISTNGTVAFGPTTIFKTQDGTVLTNLPFPSDVQTLSINQQKLFRYNATNGNLVVYDMNSIMASPAQPLNPIPTNGATVNLPLNKVSWSPSKWAFSYRIFMGTNQSAVAGADTNSPLYLGSTTLTSFPAPGSLTAGVTYFWRVDSIGYGSTTTGLVWPFTVSPVTVSPQPLFILGLANLPALPQSLSLNSAVPIAWTLSVAQPWLSASVTNGTTPASLTLNLNTTNLGPGLYTNTITFVFGGIVLQYPVVLQLSNLVATEFVVDRNRDYIYALHTGSGVTNDAFVLFLNAGTGVIEKVIPIGINATDMTINAIEDRMYVCNLQNSLTHVVDLVTGTELAPISVATNVLKINAATPGRAVVEELIPGQPGSVDLINTTNGQTLASINYNVADGECDPSGQYYYHGMPNPDDIYKFNILSNSFVQVASGSGNRFASGGSVIISPDGSRVLWGGVVFDTNLSTLWDLGAPIYGCNTNASIIFSSQQGFDTVSKQLIFNLPVSSSVMAVDRSNQNLWYFNNSTHRIGSISMVAVRSPTITQQPVTNTITIVGSNVVFNSAAIGLGPLSYQWTMAGINLSNGSSNVLRINNIQPSQQGDYQVIVSNSYGAATSVVAHVTVLSPVAITQQPLGTNVAAGQSVSLPVAANGTQPLTYLWTFEGTIITGATNSTLTITNMQETNEGVYRAVVQNVVGSVTSSVATLRVIPAAPIVVSNPTSQTVGASSNAVFTVGAIGSQPLSYQWLFNSAPIVNATAQQFSLANVQSGNAGSYQVIVTNGFGAVTSSVATLSVTPIAPYFVVQPVGASRAAGTNLVLNALANGSQPIGYQWQLNGTNVSGASQTTLVFSNLALSDAGNYTLVASNIVDTSTSVVAAVAVTGVAPVFTQQPSSVALIAGSSTNLNSLATGSTPLYYQWYFQSNFLPTQTNQQLSLNSVTLASAGQYFVIASNAFNTATSSVAQVTVNQPPVLQQAVSNQVVNVGSTVVLSVQVLASGNPNYIWKLNGSIIATNAVLILTNVQPAQSGYYGVTISNQFGSVSSTARVSVMGPPSWVVAWGDNSGGETVVPTNLDDAVGVSGGDYHTLALHQNGQLLAWGYNGDGQTAVPTNGLPFVSIASGAAHNLALTANGGVVAWGRNDAGQCNVPGTAVSVLAVAAGDSHSVALLSSRIIKCWGDNTYGQVSGSAGLSGISAIAAGRNHNLALRTNGTVAGWGFNAYGQASPPQGLSGVVAIAAGYLHSAALLSNSTVVVWGDNSYGQTNTPSGLTNVVAIAAGDFHTLALQANGSIVAWGDNSYGQTNIPVAAMNVVAIASGNYHGLALTPVIPILTPFLGQSGLVIQWSGPGMLQWAPTPYGPYTNLPGLGRSFTNTDFSAPAKFFRLQR